MKRTKDQRKTAEPPDVQAPGDVHWIKARKAMEDRASWRVVSLVVIDDESIEVAFDGEDTGSRFICLRAALLKSTLAEGTPLGDACPTVIIVERWSTMIVPLGENGRPPPNELGFFTGAASLEDGSATRVLTVDSKYELRLFSIRRKSLG